MGIRVRKLAKELDRSDQEVLETLHQLGFGKYRSTEDMLPDDVVALLRKGLKDRRRTAPVNGGLGRSAPPPATAVAAGRNAPMAALVQGVVPLARSGSLAAVRAPVAVEPAPPPMPAPMPAPARAFSPVETPREPATSGSSRAADVLEGARQRLEDSLQQLRADREAIAAAHARLAADEKEVRQMAWQAEAMLAAAEVEREALAAERSSMTARQASLEAEARRIDQERGMLEVERARQSQAREAPASPKAAAVPFSEVLEKRGLRGSDEMERAFQAVSRSRVWREVLNLLEVRDVKRMEELLGEHLLLVGGEPHEALAFTATVSVAPDRADLPGKQELLQAVARLGERLLLLGLRRVTVVGLAPRWQRVLREGVDPRVELQFRLSGAQRSRSEAESDVLRTDAVLLCNLPLSQEAAEVYEAARPVVCRTREDHLGRVLQDWLDGLHAI